ncbi:RNA 3'-terminal phosphate cyclase [Halobellus sp. Atlit-38R]|uniref:RNA 3'-terminal phosphate cyclase n=1 Tax=Halobellus sp. Atlit-38R TaxID=2282131 RepID=UPI000EF18A58|nr:RNA 3'-terminal phosphate cyclase [Halobellus sp. Atlit-38R]RLM90301.1 RNA 3'-terminal phosphate cyclase [Halobellus sp. Atlit-38R]
MLELEGTEGGGQLVRTALTLSVLDGRPFRMVDVRGNRPNPGLKRQHLACVDLLADVADADVSGAEVGSETLTFEPGNGDSDGPLAAPGAEGAAEPREFAVDVGTAGSVTLVADTLLPLAASLDHPIQATLVGGTDVKWSPPADYLRHVKLPLLRECGLDASVTVNRRGFYPAGGGELVVGIRPSALSEIVLPARRGGADAPEPSGDMPESTRTAPESTPDRYSVRAVASEALEDAEVADRMAETAVSELETLGIGGDAASGSTVSANARYVESHSPGAVTTIAAEFGAETGSGSEVSSEDRTPLRPRAGFGAYGDRGVPSEEVAQAAVEKVAAWRETDAPVDPHLGDQLVVWLALAGGSVRIPRVTDHVETNVALVEAFSYDVSIREAAGGSEATVSASPPDN